MSRFVFAAIFIWLGFPAPQSGYVHDFAGLLTPKTAGEINALASAAEHETSVKIAVVTVKSLEGLTVEQYANDLFNAWGIGSAGTNNGVLLLVAPGERKMRIEVGYGLEPLLPDAVCGRIRDQDVLPWFKQGKYEQGILAGSRRLVERLRANPAAARGIEASAPPWMRSFLERYFGLKVPVWLRTPIQRAEAAAFLTILAAVVFVFVALIGALMQAYPGALLLIAVLLVGALNAYVKYAAETLPQPGDLNTLWGGSGLAALVSLLFSLRVYLRYRGRRCPQCRNELTLLDETTDDARLTEVQQLEEQLGSVDYDVWYCPKCLCADTERYVAMFSSFSKCPKCRNRTYEEKSTTVKQPTEYHTGTERIDCRCYSCAHQDVRYGTLARIRRSSSRSSGSSGWSSGSRSSSSSSRSSGGSCGGGSSGGGGASGGW